jgi:hypothetical protein
LTAFDPNHISRITRARNGTGIEVETGTFGGLTLRVTIVRGGSVELSDVSAWIV